MESPPLKQKWTDHKDTRDNVLTAHCHIQGNLLEYKVTCQLQSRLGGPRGDITTFSDRARLTMLKEFHKINFSFGPTPLFVTLTYPDEKALPDLDQRNIHRKVMARHLERIVGRHVPAAWRIEWEPRKSGTLIGTYCPHWHLLIFTIGFIPYDEINLAWRKTIGHDGYCRTEIKRLYDNDPIRLYMAKYISKDAVSPSLVYAAYQNRLGRAYGWLRKAEIPRFAAHARPSLSDAQRRDLMSLAAEILPWASESREESFTLLGEVAQDALKIIDGLPLTDDREG